MENTSFYKAAIMLGGGFLLFWLFKSKDGGTLLTAGDGSKASFDAAPVTAKQKENALIVMSAYQAAMMAGEPAMVLSELNRECMKDYGLKCYQKTDGGLCVTDASGTEVLSA